MIGNLYGRGRSSININKSLDLELTIGINIVLQEKKVGIEMLRGI